MTLADALEALLAARERLSAARANSWVVDVPRHERELADAHEQFTAAIEAVIDERLSACDRHQ